MAVVEIILGHGPLDRRIEGGARVLWEVPLVNGEKVWVVHDGVQMFAEHLAATNQMRSLAAAEPHPDPSSPGAGYLCPVRRPDESRGFFELAPATRFGN
jgi:hypothetical protein